MTSPVVPDTAQAPPPPVAKFRSLVLAAMVVLLAVVLLFSARQGTWVQLVVVALVQVACVLSWIVATDPPSRYFYGGVALAVAAAADVGAVLHDNPTLAPVGYALAGGLLLAIVGQLGRRDGRSDLTDAFGGTIALNVMVAGYAAALVLAREDNRILGLGLLAVGSAVTLARVIDIVPVGPRLHTRVPRSLLGLFVGLLAGVGVAVLAGAARTELSPGLCVLAGLLGAGGGLIADLGMSVAEADDGQQVGAGDRSWLASARGPLAAFAGAIPAVYVAAVLASV
ncbi:MAG: hypothetical protein H0T78_05915 [Longispora sp.]|nr:hypothetical protein [Longispora sp. (in: high G+C Gram-positive bacteria)]